MWSKLNFCAAALTATSALMEAIHHNPISALFFGLLTIWNMYAALDLKHKGR